MNHTCLCLPRVNPNPNPNPNVRYSYMFTDFRVIDAGFMTVTSLVIVK